MWYTIIAVREDGSNITIKVPNDFAGMAEQADARDLKSRGVNPPVPVRFRFPAPALLI